MNEPDDSQQYPGQIGRGSRASSCSETLCAVDDEALNREAQKRRLSPLRRKREGGRKPVPALKIAALKLLRLSRLSTLPTRRALSRLLPPDFRFPLPEFPVPAISRGRPRCRSAGMLPRALIWAQWNRPTETISRGAKPMGLISAWQISRSDRAKLNFEHKSSTQGFRGCPEGPRQHVQPQGPGPRRLCAM